MGVGASKVETKDEREVVTREISRRLTDRYLETVVRFPQHNYRHELHKHCGMMY